MSKPDPGDAFWDDLNADLTDPGYRKGHAGTRRDWAKCTGCTESMSGVESINWAMFHEVVTGHQVECLAGLREDDDA